MRSQSLDPERYESSSLQRADVAPSPVFFDRFVDPVQLGGKTVGIIPFPGGALPAVVEYLSIGTEPNLPSELSHAQAPFQVFSVHEEVFGQWSGLHDGLTPSNQRRSPSPANLYCAVIGPVRPQQHLSPSPRRKQLVKPGGLEQRLEYAGVRLSAILRGSIGVNQPCRCKPRAGMAVHEVDQRIECSGPDFRV